MMAEADPGPPLVSVVTPVYNGAEHVAACIESVARSLTFGRLAIEHVLVDDGSLDDSVGVIERAIVEFAPLGYRGRLLRIPHSGRPAYARNRALEVAGGKYVFCLDHDDLLLQNALRYLAEHLEASGEQVAYGDFLRFNAVEGYEIGHDYHGWPHADAGVALYSMFRGDHFYQHSFMFSRALSSQVGDYDERLTYGEDLDLCTRFILAGHVPRHLPVTTHIHRNHGANLTADYGHRSPRWLEEWRAHYAKYREALRERLSSEQIADIEATLGLDSGGRGPTGPGSPT